jgi:hypothetical protein
MGMKDGIGGNVPTGVGAMVIRTPVKESKLSSQNCLTIREILGLKV